MGGGSVGKVQLLAGGCKVKVLVVLLRLEIDLSEFGAIAMSGFGCDLW